MDFDTAESTTSTHHASFRKHYLDIIDKLWQNCNSNPFKTKVNYKKLHLFNYPIIVKNPMDLSTLKRKVIQNQYKHFEAFQTDLMLIWSNCKIYNQETSEIYLMAEQLEKVSNDLIGDLYEIMRNEEIHIKQDEKREELEEKVVDNIFEKRITLNKMTKKMNLKQILAMLKVIKDENIEAVDIQSEQKFTVKVDQLKEKTVDKLIEMFQHEIDYKMFL